MRLTLKLTLATLLSVLLVVARFAYTTSQREVTQFEHDTRIHHEELGTALAAALATAWEAGGMRTALDMIESANANQPRVRIRWVSFTEKDAALRPPFRIDPWMLRALARGEQLSMRPEVPEAPSARLYTYVPVPLITPFSGAVEISQSLEEQQGFANATLKEAAAATLMMSALCGLIALAFGSFLVARPIRELIQLSERIAQGDLSARLSLNSRDELTTLSEAMNRMSLQLAESQHRLADEAYHRLTAQEQLRHADRLNTVGKLASGVAHELGTPLHVVAGNARMIATGELPLDEAKEAARTIHQQAEAMTRIIRQLLDFARRRAPEKAMHNLRELCEGTIAMLRHLADKRGVRLSLEGDPACTAEIDAGQIRQVLTNLVMNGIQAMPRGGDLKLTVSRSLDTPPPDVGGPARDILRLSVKDQGEGIPPEILPHVFEPFFTTKGVGEGTGLGLSVSHGLVREHGGWISVESEVARGSTFILHLPERA